MPLLAFRQASEVARDVVDKRRLVEIMAAAAVGDMSHKVEVLFLARSSRFSLKVGKKSISSAFAHSPGFGRQPLGGLQDCAKACIQRA